MKQIITAMLFFLISLTMTAQNLYDGNGVYKGKVDNKGYFYNKRLYNDSGTYIGFYSSGRVYNGSGEYKGSIRDGYIYDKNGTYIGRANNVSPLIITMIYFFDLCNIGVLF